MTEHTFDTTQGVITLQIREYPNLKAWTIEVFVNRNQQGVKFCTTQNEVDAYIKHYKGYKRRAGA